jgi:hypothetical protein
MKQPITLEQFNLIHESHDWVRLKGYGYYTTYFKLTKLKEVKKGVKEWIYDEEGIRLVYHSEAVKKQVFDTKSFDKMLLRYLRILTPTIKANITDTKGVFNPATGKLMSNKADKGRADITAQYTNFELGVETKQKYETQKESQKEFERMANAQTFRKYILVRSFEDFQMKMYDIFENLPTQENWRDFVITRDASFLERNKRLVKLAGL